MTRRRHLTADEIARMVPEATRLDESGVKRAEIATRLGVSEPTVRNLLGRAKWPALMQTQGDPS